MSAHDAARIANALLLLMAAGLAGVVMALWRKR